MAQAAGKLDLGRLPPPVLNVAPASRRLSRERLALGVAAVQRGRNAISHTNRNFVIAYIFLVILPVLGLVGILKGGRTLSAPYSVDGSWKIESSLPSASPCGNLPLPVSNTPLSISQSGKTLVVTLGGGTKTTTGTLDGKIIKAQFPEVTGTDKPAGACGDGRLTLTATLDPLAEPRTMSGTLSVEGCASCAPIEFHAARQPKSPGATR